MIVIIPIFGLYDSNRTQQFELYNAQATFQRCMITMFVDLVEEIIKIFINDFLVFGLVLKGA